MHPADKMAEASADGSQAQDGEEKKEKTEALALGGILMEGDFVDGQILRVQHAGFFHGDWAIR